MNSSLCSKQTLDPTEGYLPILLGCARSDPPAVAMTEEWVEAALAGDLEQAERWTYGESRRTGFSRWVTQIAIRLPGVKTGTHTSSTRDIAPDGTGCVVFVSCRMAVDAHLVRLMK